MNSLYNGILVFFLCPACSSALMGQPPVIQDLGGRHEMTLDKIWLSHEHTLVDFIGADEIQPEKWNRDSVLSVMLPYFEELKAFEVDYFVDCTPNYLGRDVVLLERIAKMTGIKILTNTGFYGARNNHFIPSFAKEMSPEALAELWIKEYEHGINGTALRPGFIKIGVDVRNALDTLHQKLVQAAGIAHLETGLTIASHTGRAMGFWPQARILEAMDVAPSSFIWVHAQFEEDNTQYVKAAEKGYWISLDGLGWEFDNHLKKLLFAKQHGILDKILISHDAGWYDPQKREQSITPYTAIFQRLIPTLTALGFSEGEIRQLISVNPARAYAIKKSF